MTDNKYDPHIGCFSWPNCEDDPLGCYVVMGKDVETYGHRDHTDKSVCLSHKEPKK